MHQFFRPYIHKSDEYVDLFLKEHTIEDSNELIQDLICLIPFAWHFVWRNFNSVYRSTAEGLADCFGFCGFFPPFYILIAAILTLALAIDVIREVACYSANALLLASRLIATGLFFAYLALKSVAQAVRGVLKDINQANDEEGDANVVAAECEALNNVDKHRVEELSEFNNVVRGARY